MQALLCWILVILGLSLAATTWLMWRMDRSEAPNLAQPEQFAAQQSSWHLNMSLDC